MAFQYLSMSIFDVTIASGFLLCAYVLSVVDHFGGIINRKSIEESVYATIKEL